MSLHSQPRSHPTPRYLLLLLLHQLLIGSEHLCQAAPQQLLQGDLGQGVTTDPVHLLAQAEQEALHVPRGLGRRTEFICTWSVSSIPFHIPSDGRWGCPTSSAATKLCPTAWLRHLTGSDLLTPQILGYSISPSPQKTLPDTECSELLVPLLSAQTLLCPPTPWGSYSLPHLLGLPELPPSCIFPQSTRIHWIRFTTFPRPAPPMLCKHRTHSRPGPPPHPRHCHLLCPCEVLPVPPPHPWEATRLSSLRIPQSPCCSPVLQCIQLP